MQEEARKYKVNLSKLLEQASFVDETTATNLKRAGGFRNVAVHDDEDIDWAIVYAICTKHLQDFREFAGMVAGYAGI